MDLDVVMIHNNKVWFYIKHIECDGNLKSIINEVRDEMGIEMNYVNTENHVPESDKNNRVIKEMFQISYNQFPYKYIPKIIIRQLAINVA